MYLRQRDRDVLYCGRADPPHASSQSRPAQRSRGGAGRRPSAAAESRLLSQQMLAQISSKRYTRSRHEQKAWFGKCCARKQQERWSRQFTEGSERQQDEDAPSERHSRHREPQREPQQQQQPVTSRFSHRFRTFTSVGISPTQKPTAQVPQTPKRVPKLQKRTGASGSPWRHARSHRSESTRISSVACPSPPSTGPEISRGKRDGR